MRALITTCLLALAATTGQAQETLTIFHKGDSATFRNKKYASGDRIRVSGTLKVRVTETNSAVYTCSVETKDVKVPEVEAGTAFLAGLSSYLPELVERITVRGMTPTDERSRKVEQQLNRVNDAVLGPRGLRSALTLTMKALDDVRGDPALVNNKPISDYRDSIRGFCDNAEKCRRLNATAKLADALSELGKGVGELHASGNAPDHKPLFSAATAALAKADEMMAFAYGTEKLVSKTYNATSSMDCDDVPVAYNKGFATTIKVAPSTIPGLQRAATAAPYEATFEIQPDWLLRPTVGLSLLYASAATYPTFGTRKRTDGSFEVQEAGSVDNRIAYGLTLSTTWRFLDWRDDKGIALYLPELTVNPSDDVKAISLGGAISISFLKIGAGMIWNKHATLSNGQGIGTVLADPDELSTRERYGRGKRYISFSLVGLPPFLPGA